MQILPFSVSHNVLSICSSLDAHMVCKIALQPSKLRRCSQKSMFYFILSYNMKRPCVSQGPKTTCQNNNILQRKKKRLETVGEHVFPAPERLTNLPEKKETSWFTGDLWDPWETKVPSPQSGRRVTATQGGPQRAARNHSRIPLETLESLTFSAGFQPKHCCLGSVFF